MTTSDALRLGKAELLRDGWQQGNYFNPQTQERCMIGALLGAVLSYNAINAACNALIAVIGHPHVAVWNDQPGRTPEEVLDAFDRAIALAESQDPSVPAAAISEQVGALTGSLRA